MYEESDETNVQNRSVNQTDGFTLSYLTCPQDAAGAFLGALMITDDRARPLHFSFVEPVRPTKMQRMLYGPTLEEHVRIDVIAKKLFKEIPYVPDVLLVDVPEMVGVRQIVEFPTAFLKKTNSEEIEPGRLSALQYDTGGNQEDQEKVGRILASLETAVDLFEPFNRMREALIEAIKTVDTTGGE